MRRCSFEEIVDVCMRCPGVRLDPEISMSDWSAEDLSHEQIRQASLDVYVCFQLGVCHRVNKEEAGDDRERRCRLNMI
ncbi:hypothetical protein F2Q68_00026282 [Brassica cretica]|uniref:3'-5' exonuclease domain-containing protein n=1 Tax=Brassica cretica TaxID=69181 RepID=A0A8S9II94_BRACR|nr:hypothetical protein F2Q68_00026282 [Brassica cretica]